MEGFLELLVLYGFCLSFIIAIAIILFWGRINTFSFSESAKAKDFTPMSDRGVVFVFRLSPNKYSTALPILLSGRLIAKLRNGNFIRLELPEGEYSIAGYSKKYALNFHIKNGEVAFIKQGFGLNPFYLGPVYKITYFDNDACKAISKYYLVRPHKHR